MVVVYVLMALIGAAVAIFALQNLDPVVIRFLTWRIEGVPAGRSSSSCPWSSA